MRLAQIIIFLVGALAAVPDHVFIVLTPEIGCREISRILDEEKAGGQTMAHVDNARLRIRYRVEGNGHRWFSFMASPTVPKPGTSWDMCMLSSRNTGSS
jgi:hypothetical protein